ncbi:hypothetical protein PI125_g12953 [Phytophthora idaei]|nr:hypothetical protein PI125_g12953 [Phytophthora idaei]
MKDDPTKSKRLDELYELIVGLRTQQEPLDEARQLIFLLSGLPAE